jgi:hypothetical protein
MIRLLPVAALACGALFAAASALAQPAPATPPAAPAPAAPPAFAPNDYSDKGNWLCWPGRQDACTSDLTATVVKADGKTEKAAFAADANAPIDCFYVYPTVSRDPGAISTMQIEPAETNVVIQQAARLTAHCRLYAPMYRQFTLTALQANVMRQAGGTPPATPPAPPPGSPPPGPRVSVGFNDVQDAWNYYLAHENHGRGVVLVGHSQGSGVLTQLIKADIDGKPDQAKLVSAILMGTALVVPENSDVGGDFKSIPLCHSATQLGCVIAYSSFRETSPPPANSRFGRPRGAPQPGMEAACVNPAALAGGPGEAKTDFGMPVVSSGGQPPYAWDKGVTISTPFVSTPGLITATCVREGGFHYLSIHINADPASPRASDIPGDVVVPGLGIQKDWGLHLIDANLFMGNLVDIVGDEGKAWVAKK